MLKEIAKYERMFASVEKMAKQREKQGKGTTSPAKRLKQRTRMIDLGYQYGGKPFVIDLRKYGCTEDGDPLFHEAGFDEIAEALADFRIAEIYTTGPSQCGKSLLHGNLNAWLMAVCKLNTAIIYPQRSLMDKLIGQVPHPILKHWAKKLKLTSTKEDSDNNQITSIGGVKCNGSHLNTNSKTPSREGLAAVGADMTGYKADFIPYVDEISQTRPGAKSKIIGRTHASVLNRCPAPIRLLGTCGSGAGIERFFKRCKRNFYQHSQCENPACGKVFPVDIKGCLFQPIDEDDSGRPIYTNETGKFTKWYCHDETDPVETAYLGCPHCGSPIGQKQRTENVWWQCTKTGQTLRDFLDALDVENPYHWEISFHISAIANRSPNLATIKAKESQSTTDTDDFQQQHCGHPSETRGNELDVDTIRRCINLALPDRKPTVRIAGIDQGRQSHYLWISDFWVPTDHKLTVGQKMELAIEHPIFIGEVGEKYLPQMLKSFKVDYGAIDTDPERKYARDVSESTVIQLAKQKPGQFDEVKQSKVTSGSTDIPCWGICNELFQNYVLHSFLTKHPNDGLPLMRLGDEWEQWLYDVSPSSPVRHLTAMTYDRGKRIWVRPEDHCDDFFFANMFVKAGLYLWLSQPRKKAFRPPSVGAIVR